MNDNKDNAPERIFTDKRISFSKDTCGCWDIKKDVVYNTEYILKSTADKEREEILKPIIDELYLSNSFPNQYEMLKKACKETLERADG